jgi:beta-lactamase superfamily II metal-dependent hydrolase
MHIWTRPLAAVALILGAAATPAQAQTATQALSAPSTTDRADDADVVIRRNVTVRAAPERTSAALAFPAVGTRLDLLDDGARQRGYYHVRLPDGREGWVYQSFVQRIAGQPGSAAFTGLGGDRLAVHYIDVEQGNSALLEFPCGAILIDAGGRGEAAGRHLVEYLDAFFARRTDLDDRLAAVFVTHTHSDHNSNLRRLAERYRIGGYVHNGVMTGSGRAAAGWMAARAAAASPAIPAVAVADVGTSPVTGPVIDPLECPRVDPKIQVLSGAITANPGWSAAAFKNGNNHSLVIRVDYGDASFLFPGDLENEGIARLLGRLADPGDLDVDVLEVSHHGAANGTTAAWLAALTPKIAVISMGPSTIHEQWTGWAYGHPRRVTVALLEQGVSMARPPVTQLVGDAVKSFSPTTIDRAVYATGWEGDVVITAAPDGRLQVATAH